VQISVSSLAELALRATLTVWIEGAVVAEVTTVIIAARACRTHTRARSVAMDGELFERESCVVVLVAFVSPLALTGQIEVVAKDTRSDLAFLLLVSHLGGSIVTRILGWLI